jgi:hypothetical protein
LLVQQRQLTVQAEVDITQEIDVVKLVMMMLRKSMETYVEEARKLIAPLAVAMIPPMPASKHV